MTGTSIRGSKERSTLSISAFSATDGSESACSTEPSPENPRDFSGLNPMLRRAPGKWATHTLATGALPEVTGSLYASRRVMKRMSGSSTRSRSGPATHTDPAVARVASLSERTARVAHMTLFVADWRGSPWMNVRAAAASREWVGFIRDESICVSANPLSQRTGRGTLSSITSPSRVVVSNPSFPTSMWRGSPARREAKAVRSGGFTSTFVTPTALWVASRAEESTSSRA